MLKVVLYAAPTLLAVAAAGTAESLEGAAWEIMKQVPALAVLAALIYLGLRHLEKRDKLLSKLHEESVDVIRENTSTLTQVLTSCQTCHVEQRETHRDVEELLRRSHD